MNPWVELIELIWTLLWMSDLSAGSSTRGGRTTSKERANSRYCRKTPTTMALTSGESQGVLENDLIEFHRTCRASYLSTLPFPRSYRGYCHRLMLSNSMSLSNISRTMFAIGLVGVRRLCD